MTQPAPFDTVEITGWWANPKPFMRLPLVVGSVYGHTLRDPTTPPIASFIIAANTTNCSDCVPVADTGSDRTPMPGIPTVVGSICRHPLSGTSTPIGPTTIPAAATPLCYTCIAFGDLAQDVSASYEQWHNCHKAFNWTYYATALQIKSPALQNPTYEDVVTSSFFREYMTRRKSLARRYERSRLAYEINARDHQEHLASSLPIVNKHGAALIQSLEYENQLIVRPRERQTSPRRVRFEEDQQHPTRDTARSTYRYKRRTKAYRPGRYADITGNGWENTSNPYQTTWRGSIGPDRYPASGEDAGDQGNKGWIEIGSSQTVGTMAEDTSDSELAKEDTKKPFFGSLPVIYTQSSPPPQPQKGEQKPSWEGSVSEK